jgi:hypothetical protein
MNRTCGDCQLCCRLLPVKDIAKPAGQRCEHQKHGTGCAIYATRPASCRVWSCGWLTDPETAALSRPDRSHYVIDLSAEFITVEDNKTGFSQKIPVLQVWCDPNYPDAHRDPKLRAMLELNKAPTIVRYDSQRAVMIFPPSMASDGQWHEIDHGTMVPEHTPAEINQVIADKLNG